MTKRQRGPRPASTYRAARRNAVLRPTIGPGTTWRGIKPTGAIYHPPVRLNRSRKWAPKKSYAEAA